MAPPALRHYTHAIGVEVPSTIKEYVRTRTRPTVDLVCQPRLEISPRYLRNILQVQAAPGS
jgi:hypothetical protein